MCYLVHSNAFKNILTDGDDFNAYKLKAYNMTMQWYQMIMYIITKKNLTMDLDKYFRLYKILKTINIVDPFDLLHKRIETSTLIEDLNDCLIE